MPASTFPAEWRAAALIILCLAGIPVTQAQNKWLPLAKAGIHDPNSTGLRQLQHPTPAISPLPPHSTGHLAG